MNSSNQIHQQQSATTEKFRNQYRIQSSRLKNYNYGAKGAYFITICTKNREHFFGKISEGKMTHSQIGKITINEWKRTEEIRKNIKLGEWILMPNHLHGIIIINKTIQVETHCNASLRKNNQNQFGPQSQNLAAIIRGFKGSATKQIHLAGFSQFAWQTRFHDHIIRDSNEVDRISEYIKSNPQNWNTDNYV